MHESSSECDASLRLDRRAILKTMGAGLATAGLAGQASAQGGFPPSERTRWGDSVAVGDGTVQAFLTRGHSGTPRFLGVQLTETALTGLPESGERVRHTVPLPEGTPTVANVGWVTVDWNPDGHVPEGVYDVPHFDFHCYFDSREYVERRIPPGECDVDGESDGDGKNDGSGEGDGATHVPCDVYETATEPLPDVQRPPGYVSTGHVMARMGNHWVERDAPEFRGDPFTHTYVYGSFDGRLNFVEPMVTRAFLREVSGTVVADVATPRRFPTQGFYPTQYAIRRVAGDGPEEDVIAVYLRRFRQFPGD